MLNTSGKELQSRKAGHGLFLKKSSTCLLSSLQKPLAVLLRSLLLLEVINGASTKAWSVVGFYSAISSLSSEACGFVGPGILGVAAAGTALQAYLQVAGGTLNVQTYRPNHHTLQKA
eukprot:5095388-Amphidinium_carterae.1